VGAVFGGTPHELRPTWRGWLHASTFVAAIPAGVLLIIAASGAAARAAASVYAAAVLLLFGTSAGYHLLARSERARRIMQRLDHSMIFVLIAGTYVPMCVVALPPAWGIPLLVVVSAGALAGVVTKLVAFRVQWVGYVLYPLLGWLAIVAAPALVIHLSAAQLALVAAGGVVYTIGIPVLALHRPDPWPRAFGYHEVWHSCTILAAVFHFAAIATLVA
jgi:hemolysin III